ncbi:MarR family transcriptional regulator [Paenibacillus sp. LHD-38]|uniref:MarR family winged helix-turn-helix transcriptional regulator n=1 Tax=Paenibacillus sp. LHD-38 TaxID=3072143 RepID=UPI00280DC777|nr:MarR family transcriptional regulator [Paenibacillus sp. LHD-38]MDQ8738086.1 MarR family transcriptional regulator [Paenibacillus sp. LHD-38]
MNNDVEWKVVYPILKSVYKKLREEWHKGSDCSFSINQTRMLQFLNRKSPMKSTELAELLFITAGGVTLMGDKLLERGLIHRLRCDEDRRVVLLAITDDGKKYIESFEERDEAIIQYISERISNEDLQHLKRIFKLLDS